MRRATISLPDALDEKVERFRMSQPARPSLTSVIQAALEKYLETGSTRADTPTPVTRILKHRADIRRVVARHGGSNPRLFGSASRGEADEESDVDILIDLEPGRTLFDLAALRGELERLLGVPVDIMSTSGLEGDLKEEIVAEALAL